MKNPYADVIIVGAGPAGTTAAYHLASAGVSVLILEKSIFPRYKVCGGGLTHKILTELPFDLSPVIENTIYSIRFSSKFDDVFTRTSPVPLMYCTMRPRLDEFLLRKAIEAGARHQTSIVREIRQEGEMYEITGDPGMFRCRIVIGADGAAGVVARTFNLRKHIAKGLAWEAEVAAGPELLDSYKSTVFLDWGTFPGGYAWIFPKKDHFSVGVGGPAAHARQMMPYYMKFMRLTGIFEFPSSPCYPEQINGTLSLKSWPIPVRTARSDFHSGQVMVTGDAAGLTDPLTGEGIWYAVRSGRMAATAAAEYLAGKKNAFACYSEKVNEELMPELLEAGKISNIFNIFPGKVHHFVRDNERAWRAFGKVLRGERWYADVRKGFGRWKSAWNLVSFLCGVIRKIKRVPRFQDL